MKKRFPEDECSVLWAESFDAGALEREMLTCGKIRLVGDWRRDSFWTRGSSLSGAVEEEEKEEKEELGCVPAIVAISEGAGSFMVAMGWIGEVVPHWRGLVDTCDGRCLLKIVVRVSFGPASVV